LDYCCSSGFFRFGCYSGCANSIVFDRRGAFDGTYQLVSSAKVDKTYTTRKGQMGQCPNRIAGPLTIVQGQARYTSATGYQVEGTVGSQGELAMRSSAPPTLGGSQPIEISVYGRIDGTGTVRARQRSNLCSYDFVWRK
jgi:hypothetical protein